MSEAICTRSLVSQLLDSIDEHLKDVRIPNVDTTDDDDLWLSSHRSIFSSYGSDQHPMSSSIDQCQSDGFPWNFSSDRPYHHLTFDHRPNQSCQATNLSQWSMNLSSNPTTSFSDRRRQTSWNAIKDQSIHRPHSSSSSSSSIYTSENEHRPTNHVTLYQLYQRARQSEHHPCRLYRNFSDRSLCDSIILSVSDPNFKTQEQPISPSPRIKLQCPTTFSQLKFQKSQSHPPLSSTIAVFNENFIPCQNMDRSLQTSFHEAAVLQSKSVDRLSINHRTNPPCQRSLSSLLSHPLPDLHFLTHYAKENPSISSKMTRPEGTEISSSTSSSNERSVSSSGYFSSTTPSRPLKSCLKRTKTDDPSTRANVLANAMAGDIFTLTRPTLHQQRSINGEHRRYSTSGLFSVLSKENPCFTLSEEDLRTKKNVSFCDDISRRLITPSNSPKYRSRSSYQDDSELVLVPEESLTESPPNEFRLSETQDEINEYQPMNDIESIPTDDRRKSLIDRFASTVLQILEIKCNDPQSYYLDNQKNQELDRILRYDLCSLIREVLEDGLRQQSGAFFSKKIHLWRLIDLSTPKTSPFAKAKSAIPSSIDWIDKFNAFIYHLLNFQCLAEWFTDFLSHRNIIETYYQPWALLQQTEQKDFFERLTNQLEKFSPLSFRVKYSILPKELIKSPVNKSR